MTFDAVIKFKNPLFYMLFMSVGRIVFVAVVAGIFGVSISMASFTGQIVLAAMIEGKSVLGKLGRCPGSGRVASATILTEQSGMNFWLFVTGSTLIGSTPEGLIHMAILATNVGMCAIQGKDLVMIKIGHCVAAIVAGQAIRPKEGGVVGYEGRIGRLMAGCTLNDVGLNETLAMTTLAFQSCPIKIGLVVGQAEAGKSLVVEAACQESNLGIAPFVVGVARLTTAVIYQLAM
jgi:hypothetical protein